MWRPAFLIERAPKGRQPTWTRRHSKIIRISGLLASKKNHDLLELPPMQTYRQILPLLFLLLLTPLQAQERHYDKAHGYSVEIPAGWTSQPTGEDPVEKASWKSPDDEVEASVLMMESADYGLAGLLEVYKSDLRPEQIVHESSVDIGGLPGHLLVTEEVEGVAT